MEIGFVSALAFNLVANAVSLSIGIFGLYYYYAKLVPNSAMKVCTVGWLVALVSMALGLGSYALTCLLDQKVDYRDDWSSVKSYERMLLLYGAFLLRFSILAVVVERGIATYTLKSYGQKNPVVIGAVTVVYLIVLPVLQLAAYYLFALTGTKLTAMVFSLDIFALVICLFVRRWNNRLLKKRLVSNLSLSERYQINENIRFLQILFPSALANYGYCTFLTCMHLTTMFGLAIPTDTRMMVTHVGYTTLVLTSLFAPVIRNGSCGAKLKQATACCKSKTTQKVDPKRVVVDDANAEAYFSNYHKAWQPMNTTHPNLAAVN